MSTPPKPQLSRIIKAQNANHTNLSKPHVLPSSSNSSALAPQRTQVPFRLMELEPRLPFAAVNDNPLFDVVYAARILGISQDLLEKWRQRNQGPDYIQYGTNGPVRYELSALEAYKAAHRVYPSRQPRRNSRES